MTIEIELKYLVNDVDTVDKITALLTKKEFVFTQSEQTLSNCYFDTAELALRHQDMGLRVRSCPDFIEQTIKSKGKVIGGLHQRPEYNVTISEPFPQLALFPEDIWKENQDVVKLQSELVSLFSTDFHRTIWTVNGNEDSIVELVFDQGEISANGQREGICEIELELIKGSTEHIFHLASILFHALQIRPGTQSKAARGYALWANKKSTFVLTPLELVPLEPDYSINDAFVTGIEFGLTQLQAVLNRYIEEPSLACLEKTTEILALLRQGFWLFDNYLPLSTKYIRDELSHYIQQLKWVDNAIYLQELTTKTGNYRKKVEYSQQLVSQLKLEKRRMPDVQHVIEFIHSTRFNELQLMLLQLVVSRPTIDDFNGHERELLAFSKTWLDKSLQDLYEVMSGEGPLSSEQYVNNRKLLNRSLLTGSWFGNLYDKNERLEFRNPWLDLKQGMSELQTLYLLHQQLELLDEQPQKLVNWQASKVENLLAVLDISRQNALSITPYWRR
ncbi:inorganic triphosphatase [Colwelliaceae bacterium 6471]